MRIGLMGGTFDPVHVGHLILAEQAVEQFGLERVLFVTAAQPPHKLGEPMSDVADRLEMTRLAIDGNPKFESSTLEIDRPGPSYTIDTVNQLREAFSAGTEIYLLLGADEAVQLMSWRDPYGIQALATIAVASRPDAHVAGWDLLVALPEDVSSKILPVQMPTIGISSTDLRERVRSGRSIRYLVPRAVEEYIWSKGLYQK